MSDTDTPTPVSPSPRRRWIWPGMLAGLGLAAIVAGLTLSPISAAARAGLFGGHRGHDPEAAREHIDFAAEWILSRIDASDAQKQEVKAILGRTLAHMTALRGDHEGLRAAVVAELTAPSVDREALEKLRADQVLRLEDASKQLTASIADIADVLDAEQRVQLAELAEKFHGRRHGRHRWH